MTNEEEAIFFSKLTQRAGFYDVKAAKNAYFGLLHVIFEEIYDKNKVELPNFGVFLAKKRKSRNFRNVKTGQIEVLGATKELKFSPGRALRDRIHQMKGKIDDIVD